MNESDWWACQQPQRMLEFLLDRGRLSERKALLFAMACWRQVWPLLPDACRSAVQAAEQAADGGGTAEDRACGLLLAEGPLGSLIAGQLLAGRDTRYSFQDPSPWKGYVTHAQGRRLYRVNVLRDLFGPLPFRPVAVPAAILAWNDDCVVKLAAGIYQERDFSSERMGVLADALEEAGLVDEEVLGHVRGSGPHCSGCWVVDVLTGRA